MRLLTASIICLILVGCISGIKPEQLQGRWNYVRVEKPDSPSDSVTRAELEDKKPYIELKPDGKLQIIWGGQVLSHGTYELQGKNIQFTEALPDGKKRKFPFYIQDMTGKKMVFETVGADASRVTALKQ
ncbi:hypothetical protein MUY27_11150 [Mucilaginibacter sp. RS28]|uniref:Lipocalin-like domain-containing protein n=1 Tax=Mucilaginibacter straminoryzae TaxID=2932774 RepID=A0A9X1X554_9SPHI|nr:hypothetical protein [Mucilaginibacter straminoryzae]MCJ8210265.1 hypothetical protein [Mucilaginibacter straminoryzae]